MTPARRPALADRLDAAARHGGDLPALAAAVCAAVRTAVPYDFACLATSDPSTGLISWAWKTASLDIGDEDWAGFEYGEWDVNLFTEIAARPDPVGVLSIDTGGHPETCRRFREFMAPHFGFTDELRLALRTQGLVWGALALYRGAGGPAFSAGEARLLAGAHTRIAELVRDAVFSPDPAAPGPAPGPAVIVVDGADRVTNLTPAAGARIEELGGWDDGSLPIGVLTAVAAARATPELAVARARGRSGTWLVVRASAFSAAPGADGGPAADIVVTIDVATSADISAMALAARGLSAREQDVASLVLQGAATRAIAATLHLSPHTVQDHLKSIFAKLGVNSRREMVGKLVLG